MDFCNERSVDTIWTKGREGVKNTPKVLIAFMDEPLRKRKLMLSLHFPKFRASFELFIHFYHTQCKEIWARKLKLLDILSYEFV